MKFSSAPMLEGDRVVLRAHRVEDFEPYAAMFASDRSKFMDGPVSRSAAWRMFAADVGQWPLLGFGCWAVDLRASGEHIGQVGLNFPDNFPERELGWVLWGGFDGHGYAFEAASLARRFAFDDLNWPTFVSYIDPDNAPSIALAERLGAVRDPDGRTPDGDGALVYRHSPD